MSEPNARHRLRMIAAFLFWSLVFGISYTQAPLYYSNQTQYFLHGAADAGIGHLDQDWLANTKDPTPLFSALVAFTLRYLHDGLFYFFYLLVLGLYFHSLLDIFNFLTQDRATDLTRLGFITLFVGLHAGIARFASARLTGVDYPWYFQAGVAGQYLLGFGLQPSVFGVFLLSSIDAQLRSRPWQAVLWACLAGTLHGTYLLAAGMLVLSYLFLELRNGYVRRSALLAASALLIVAPAVLYNVITFSPSSAQEFGEAQSILVHFRIPHHAEPARWVDAIAYAQIAWILLGIALVRGTCLFPIMLIPFAASLLLTVVQIASASDSLALLFPWRTSAILVPLASTIVLTRLTTATSFWLGNRFARAKWMLQASCVLALLGLAIGGVCIYVFEWGYRANASEVPLLEFIRLNAKSGEVYLLPVALPKIGSGAKGAASTNFTEPPRAGKSGHLIAVDLQRFRIYTGSPTFVDFKAIPYKDAEVLEWRRRLLWNERMYAAGHWASPEGLNELAAEKITHVVTTANAPLPSDMPTIYEDAHYRVYRMPSGSR